MKLHLLCLLATLPLIASDVSKLTECACTYGKDCSNNVCSVSENGACVTVAAETNLGSTSLTGIYRTCVNKSESCKSGVVSISAKGGYWRSNTRCCHKNKCNEEDLGVPPANHILGKRKCPSCFGHDASSCKPVEVTCAESETECITIHGFMIEDSTKTPAQTTTLSTTTERSTTMESHTSKLSPTINEQSTTHTTTKKKAVVAVILADEDPSKEKSATHRPFYARGCGTKEGILGTGIPLTLQNETFYFSHGNPSLVAGNMAFSIILPSFIVYLGDKFFY